MRIRKGGKGISAEDKQRHNRQNDTGKTYKM